MADELNTSPEILIDLINFVLAFDAYVDHLKATGVEPDEFAREGATLLRRFMPELQAGLSVHLTELVERPDAAILRTPLARAKRNGTPLQIVEQVAGFFQVMLPWLRQRAPLFRSLFSGRANSVALQVLKACDEDLPALRLAAASQAPSASRMTVLRPWIHEAAARVGMPVAAATSARLDAVDAHALGTELKEVSALLQGVKPGSAESVDLAERKAELEANLADLADNGNATLVQTVAAIAQAPNSDGYATEVGRMLGMTPEQEQGLLATGKAIIAAGAGSGKTRVLAGKVVDTIQRVGAKSSEIIATSFSRKSAAELKDRIVKYGGEKVLADGDQGIGTTHSLALKLLREFDPGRMAQISLLNSDLSLIKLAMAQVKMRPMGSKVPERPAKGMFDGLYNSKAPSRPEAPKPTQVDPQSGQVTPPPPGGGSDPALKESFYKALNIIKALSLWALREFGPSTSWAKSNVQLIDSIQNRKLGFSELSDREQQAVHAMFARKGSIDALARNNMRNYRVAVQDTSKPGEKKGPNKVTSPYWKEPANEWFNLGLSEFLDEHKQAIGVKRFATAISKFRGDMVTAEEARDTYGASDPFAAVYGAYVWLLGNDPTFVGKMPIDDVIIEACKMLVADPMARSALQARYKHILVDEGQDQNRAQILLFGLIAGYNDAQTQKPYPDGRMSAKSFIFVGDDKQAIYAFRGADPEVFVDRSDLRGGDFKTYLLDTNFRSGKAIVDAANNLIQHNKRQIPMTCKANVDRKGEGRIENVLVKDHKSGAVWAADQIQLAAQGEAASMSYKDFGVAVRTNAEAMAFGVEMLKRGIPFRTKMNFFGDTTTKALVGWLRLVQAQSDDEINELVSSLFQVPRFNLDLKFVQRLETLSRVKRKNYLETLQWSWDTIYEDAWRNDRFVRPYLEALLEVRGLEGRPTEIFSHILSMKGAELGGKAMSLLESLVEDLRGDPDALDLLVEESTSGKISEEDLEAAALAPLDPLMSLLEGYEELGAALRYIKKLQVANEKISYEDDPDATNYDQSAVVIDTCHGWKGLEVKHIFVPMAADVFPHRKSLLSSDPRELEAERRLAYVAITRGENRVSIISPKISHMGKPAGVSPFVSEACVRDRIYVGIPDPRDLAEPASGKQASLEDSFLDAFFEIEEPEDIDVSGFDYELEKLHEMAGY